MRFESWMFPPYQKVGNKTVAFESGMAIEKGAFVCRN